MAFCIWQYINLVKFKVLFYNLKCSLCDWGDFNLASPEKIANLPIFNPSQNFYSYDKLFLIYDVTSDKIAYQLDNHQSDITMVA